MTAVRAVRVPEELSARVPPARRDAVRMVTGRRATGEVAHHAFRELPRLLRAGDVLVVNTSRTLPAAVDARAGSEPVVVHFSTRQDDGRWAVELRTPERGGATSPRPGGPRGAVLELAGGGRLVLEEPLSPPAGRLWLASVSMADPVAYLHRHGRPIRYRYTARDQPLSAYQTVFSVTSPAGGAGSAEMPSAGRPFTAALVTALVSRGVQIAPLVLHTGVASAEAHEPPYPERFEVPQSTARLVNAARSSRGANRRRSRAVDEDGWAGGGRAIAVGTTAVRALESACDGRGRVRAAAGWTDLVVTPERGVRAVDGLLTGLHEPQASHLLMLEAVAGAALLDRVYAEAVRERYRWHEFGDVNLLLP